MSDFKFQLYAVALYCLCIVSVASGSTPVSFYIKATKTLSVDAPIVIELPKHFDAEQQYELIRSSDQKQVKFQLDRSRRELVFLMQDRLQAEESRPFQLNPLSKDGLAESHATATNQNGTLTLSLNGQEVLIYHSEIVESPEGFSPLYRRSGHIHPFKTPAGKVVTDGFPVDHMHQHGIFAAWTKTFFEGERVDFWNQKAGTGTVLHQEVLGVESGPIFTSFQVRLQHTVLKGEPKPVLDEVWNVRLFHRQDVHLFDIESVQTCVAETPLTLAEYHYGGFAFRGSAEWIPKGSHQLITNETEDRKAGNHTRPNWVSIFGEVSGEICGAAMFSHPTNYRSPQPVRLHPSMPYFVYSPCVLGEFDLKPGEPYHSKYRYVAFDGKPDKKLLDRLWDDYSQELTVTWGRHD